jgi:prefoldin subunit 5
MDEQRLQTQRRDRELRKSEIDAERWRLKRRIEDLEREISSCHARLAALDESEQKVDDALGSNDGQVADLERRFARDMERLSTPPETAGLIADVFASTVMVHTAASEAFLETMSKLELMLGSNGDELTKHDLESIRAVMLQLLSWVRAADQLNDSSQILEKRLHDLDTQTRLLIAKIDQLAHQ